MSGPRQSNYTNRGNQGYQNSSAPRGPIQPSYQSQRNGSTSYPFKGNYQNYAPPPPPRPPMPPRPVSFIRSSTAFEPPPPPGEPIPLVTVSTSTSQHSLPCPTPPPTVAVSNSAISNMHNMQQPNNIFPPLLPPPLPPSFPYMSAELAHSLEQGATQYGKSFVEDSADLPFVPVIITEKDLKQMTETIKSDVEETKQNLLLYEDIIDPNLPKRLRDMFQPLYCKICQLTLSSPVVARDHYKGKRHTKACDVWLQNNPQNPNTKKAACKESGYNPQGLLHGIVAATQHQQFPNAQPPPPPRPPPFISEPYNNTNNYNRPPNQRDFSKPNNQTQRYFGSNPHSNNESHNNYAKRNAQGDRLNQNQNNSEFIPAYRAALAFPGPSKKRSRKDAVNGPNFDFCHVCQISLTSQVNADQHYNGQKHKQRLLTGHSTDYTEDTYPPTTPLRNKAEGFGGPAAGRNGNRFL